jgi:hypothetical protein
MQVVQAVGLNSATRRHRTGTALLGAAAFGALAALYHARVLNLADRAKLLAGGSTASFVAGILLRRSAYSENLAKLNSGDVTGWTRDQLAQLLAIVEPQVRANPDPETYSQLLLDYSELLQRGKRVERGSKLLIYLAAAHDDLLTKQLEGRGNFREVNEKLGTEFFEWMGPQSRERMQQLLYDKISQATTLVNPAHWGRLLLKVDPDAPQAFEDPSRDRALLTNYFRVLEPIVLEQPGGSWGERLRYLVEKGPEFDGEPRLAETEELLELYIAVRTPQVTRDLKTLPFHEVREKWGDQLTHWRGVVDEVLAGNTKSFHDFVRYHGNNVFHWLGPQSLPVIQRLFPRESTRQSSLRPGELAIAQMVLGLHAHHPLIVLEAVSQKPDDNHDEALSKLDRWLVEGIRTVLAARRRKLDARVGPPDEWEYKGTTSIADYQFRADLERLRERVQATPS